MQALQKMSSPTRDALVDAAKHLDYTSGLLLPGITVKTDGDSDPYPIEAMQIAQFSGQNFVLKGSVIQASSG